MSEEWDEIVDAVPPNRYWCGLKPVEPKSPVVSDAIPDEWSQIRAARRRPYWHDEIFKRVNARFEQEQE